RFREELDAGRQPTDAATSALRRAGHTILLSAAAVLVGFVALLFIPLNELRAVAIGGGLVVIVAALTAVGPLPGLLSLLGNKVNIGRLVRRSTSSLRPNGWRRWGKFVAAHPISTIVVSAMPLVLLALPLRRIDVTLPRSNWLPPSMESAQGVAALS